MGWNLVQAQPWGDQVAGQATVLAEAHPDVLLAEAELAAAAVATAATVVRALGDDAVAGGEVVHRGAHLDHGAGGLVADDQRQRHGGRWRSPVTVPIAAGPAAAGPLHQFLVVLHHLGPRSLHQL